MRFCFSKGDGSYRSMLIFGSDTVDGSEIPNNHLGWLKPYESWDNHHPWWCRILSINSIIRIHKPKHT